jgi:hypothetical protein
MSCSRLFSLAGLTLAAGAALVFVAARAQQPPKSAPAAPPAQAPKPGAAPAPKPETKPDPAATQAFDAALKQLDPSPRTCRETTLWQQMDAQGLMMQAQGKYLYGPGHHLRLDLKVACGDANGRMEIVCDGANFWRAVQLGDKDPKSITRMDWKKVQEALRQPDVALYIRDDFLQSLSFAGVRPLLEGLKQRMTFTKLEKVRWHGHDVVKLTAAWSADTVKTVLPPNQPGWPALLPRQCLVYLDAKTGWPYRLEWWGPSPPHVADVLLLEMEYRNPRELPKDQMARAFHFDPGSGQVSDQTSQTIQELTERARQMKAMRKAK